VKRYGNAKGIVGIGIRCRQPCHEAPLIEATFIAPKQINGASIVLGKIFEGRTHRY
jgi:hypothetical protein